MAAAWGSSGGGGSSPVPLVVAFPFPAWATRPSEALAPAEASADPFQGLPGVEEDIPPF